jgi:GTP-binding protein
MLEPVEEVHVEVADDTAGTVFELMGERHGTMIDMSSDSGTTYIKYLIPTRLLIGFQSQFIRATSGLGQVHSLFHGYEPIAPYPAPERQFGSLIADQFGTSTSYALLNAQRPFG